VSSPIHPQRVTAQEFMAIDPGALARAFPPSREDESRLYQRVDSVALVNVRGPLESEAGWFWDGYRGPSGVKARVAAAMASDAASIVLCINSPGGAVAGLLETIDELRGSKRKPIIAYCEGAYSAAYALATLADRVIVSRAGGVGSVGVIATAVSYSEQLAKEGVAVAVVASGAQKTDLHPALPISDAAKTRLRTRVNELASMLAGEVARSRGTTAQKVLEMQAGVFYGTEAVASGLADAVGTLSDAITEAQKRGKGSSLGASVAIVEPVPRTLREAAWSEGITVPTDAILQQLGMTAEQYVATERKLIEQGEFQPRRSNTTANDVPIPDARTLEQLGLTAEQYVRCERESRPGR
jgi:ClpP class serine protease